MTVYPPPVGAIQARQRRASLTTVAMDTLITAAVVGDFARCDAEAALEQALRWFGLVEAACSRFDARSEVSRLARRAGQPTNVSPILFEAVALALEMASLTGGAFDPAVGALLAERGFDHNYRTGQRADSSGVLGSWRDIELDRDALTITLRRPMLLDLGAVAKGLAIDLAFGELKDVTGAFVEAGGDLRVGGVNELGQPWRVGIWGARGPRSDGEQTLTPGTAAVCTSGGYARRLANGEHHLCDPRRGVAPATLSATVIASTAAAADALATAAFVLGPEAGIELLERAGVKGCVVSETRMRTTSGFETG